ncbi:Adhesion G-protein coupled receptor G6 [Holothuria leucospilota]|uniref:Adhesion G-protein coupled receptor G6 n=1 Tax=Holothuria leucospilota TaxID=206669 RepID=A0A9Q1CKE9_HOLLE|nr:Adhesion G-protein coupled receptor G6 [Holothuria leucospilota]
MVSDSDYQMESQILSIEAGSLSGTLSVSILDDDLVEVQECLVVSIQSVSWTQEDRNEQISFDTSPLVVRIDDVDSDIEFQNGDASDTDYSVPTTTLRNLRGNGEDEIFVVRIVNDELVEGDEVFTVSFRSGQEWPRIHIEQSLASTEITILDDDRDERDLATMTVSADLGTDFALTSSILTIPPGETQTSVRIQIIDDEDKEPAEEFLVSITNPSDQLRVASSERTTSVVITDDDTTRNGRYVAMAKSVVTVGEGDGKVQIPILVESEGDEPIVIPCVILRMKNDLVEEGEDDATLLVSLPYVFNESITVDLASTPVTAQSEDFMQLRRSVVIPANELSASIVFKIVDDTETEGDEVFTVMASSVTSPFRVCQETSTSTVTIFRNDQGPSVAYCPDDVTVFSMDPQENITVSWEQARFERGQDPIRTFQGFDVTETSLKAGSSITISMAATDVVGRTSVCSFDVGVLLKNREDLKGYTVNMTLFNTNDDSTEPSRSELRHWLNSHYRTGSCSQGGYAGLDILKIKPDRSFTEVIYKIFFVTLSECCIQDALINFNELLALSPADSAFNVNVERHIPDVLFLQANISINVSLGFDASIYEDPDHLQTKLLRNMLITQLSANLSNTSGFIGICLSPFALRTVAVLASYVIEVSRESVHRTEDIKIQHLNFDMTSLNVTEGLIVPVGSDVNLRDFRFCLRADITEGRTEIKLPSGLENTIIGISDFRSNPCDSLDYGEEEDTLQIIWAQCINNGVDTIWNYTVNCNATLGEYLTFLLTIPIGEGNAVEVAMQLSNASRRLESEGGADEVMQVAALFKKITNSSKLLKPTVVERDKSILANFGIATVPAGNKETSDSNFELEDIIQVDSSNMRQILVMEASSILLYPSDLASSSLLSETLKFTAAVYRTPVLFSSRYYNELNMNQSLYSRRKKRSLVPNTRVISSSLFSGGEVITAFDSMNINDSFRQWYRPLTDIYEHDSLTEVQYNILEAVTFFGCAASILGLAITLIAFITQRNLRSKRPNQILLWLCSHLLALYITFLIMVVLDSERTSEFLPPLQCGILAGVMHFITLSSLFWMLVEGVNMYILFVRIVRTHVRYFMLKAVIFADGVPLIIVVLTIVITRVAFKEDYSRQSVGNRTGGGTGLLFKDVFTLVDSNSEEKTSFEFSDWHLSYRNFRLRVIVVYRPPYSASHPVSFTTFLSEFSDLLENVVPSPHNLIILGDFNIHVDDQCDPSTLRFTDLLDSFDLENKVSSPTHTSGHTLDLVISRSNSRIDVTSVLADHFLSDHCFIHTSLICTSVEFDRKTMVYRNINRIDMDEFKKDLSQSALCDDNLNDLHSIISTCDYSLKTLLDKHAPVKSKTVTIKPSRPWFTSSLNSFKRVRRQLEKKWLCSRTQDDLNAFKKARNDFIAACDNAKRGYFSRQVQDCKGDQKKLFLLINKLTFRSTSNQLPPSIDNKSLADGFGEFFQKKVNRIASDVSIMCTNEAFQPIADQFSCADITEFSNFATLSQADVLKLINKSASKHCILDPVPTKIVKECIEILLPVITNIINLCMEHGCNYKVKYRPSSEHGNADALSRLPCNKLSEDSSQEETVYYFSYINDLPVTARDINKATRKEPVLSTVYDYVAQDGQIMYMRLNFSHILVEEMDYRLIMDAFYGNLVL